MPDPVVAMHRLFRDITAGVQTLRFLTALVCSATVTTAVAMPMAIKAMSYEPPTGLGAAASSQGASAPADPPPAPPPTTARIQTSPTVAGTAETTPITAAPSTTAAPTTTAAPATTVGVSATVQTVAPAEDPAPAPTAAPTTAPAPAAPATTAQPAPTSTAPPPTAGIDGFEITQPCGPSAHELDENQPGDCDPTANPG